MAERVCNVNGVKNNVNHHSETPGEIKLDGVDCISSLPDAILQQILSCFPTKFVLRTSVLSKRWKHVWCETPCLSFDCYGADHHSSIYKTLRGSYLAPKMTSFDVSLGDDVDATQIDKWIEFAMSHNAESISLKYRTDYIFPNFFYVNSSVKQLSLTLGCFYCTDMRPKCSVYWTSLRNLSLNRFNLPNESIANILSGCSMLETLVLNLCDKLHHLDLSKSLNLKRLEIYGDTWYQEPVEIVAPHIHYLRLTKFYQPCTLVDVSSLTEANLNLGYSGNRTLEAVFFADMVLKVLTKLQHIERLTIGTLALQMISFAEVRGVTFPQFKIKALTIETMVVRSVIPGILRLLRNSPGLKKITVYTIKCSAVPDKEFVRYLNSDGLNPNQSWMSFFPAVDAKSEHMALFMELVLLNAKTLETVVLRLEGSLDATEYQKLLLKVPTFSRNKNGRAKVVLNSFKIIP